MFDRSHEKTISISAGITSSVFTQASGQAACFDSRIWLGKDEAQVADYFRWRQSDAERCALNGWCYWLLRQQGHSYQAATKSLEAKPQNSNTLFSRNSG
jgi:tRNA(His) 5'-end guanylyltransferase